MKIVVSGNLTASVFNGVDGKRLFVSVTGKAMSDGKPAMSADGKELGIVTVKRFEDWAGFLPENLSALNESGTHSVPDGNGLWKSIRGVLKGTASFNTDLIPVKSVELSRATILTAEVDSLDAFTDVKIVKHYIPFV